MQEMILEMMPEMMLKMISDMMMLKMIPEMMLEMTPYDRYVCDDDVPQMMIMLMQL